MPGRGPSERNGTIATPTSATTAAPADAEQEAATREHVDPVERRLDFVRFALVGAERLARVDRGPGRQAGRARSTTNATPNAAERDAEQHTFPLRVGVLHVDDEQRETRGRAHEERERREPLGALHCARADAAREAEQQQQAGEDRQRAFGQRPEMPQREAAASSGSPRSGSV